MAAFNQTPFRAQIKHIKAVYSWGSARIPIGWWSIGLA